MCVCCTRQLGKYATVSCYQGKNFTVKKLLTVLFREREGERLCVRKGSRETVVIVVILTLAPLLRIAIYEQMSRCIQKRSYKILFLFYFFISE